MQAQSVVHSDFCSCNILFRIEQHRWLIKVANAGVLPAASSIISRLAFLAPELLVHFDLPELGSQAFSLKKPMLPFDPTAQDWRSPFTKESDVYAVGITLLHLFRHTLQDCKDAICAAAANIICIEIPLFPNQSITFPLPHWLASIQNIILSSTSRNPKARPSAFDIRFGSFRCCAIFAQAL